VPIERDGQYIVDGGALSNLPIETAIRLGATEIIALDLHDPESYADVNKTIDPLLTKLASAITERQLRLEIELASARGVPVHYVSLRSTPPVPLWDFKTHRDLFKIGYETMKNEMSSWPQKSLPPMAFLRLFTKKQLSWISDSIKPVIHPVRQLQWPYQRKAVQKGSTPVGMTTARIWIERDQIDQDVLETGVSREGT
jgi:hypothetical protein